MYKIIYQSGKWYSSSCHFWNRVNTDFEKISGKILTHLIVKLKLLINKMM